MMGLEDGKLECENCGNWGYIDLPPVDLFGRTVCYADEDDPDSMFVVYGTSTVCKDCLEAEEMHP